MIIRSRRARPDTYTKLLIKAFGANGSTTFKDFSQGGHAITANGNAQMSTTQSKFPPVSMYFDGTGDYLSIPDSEDWNFGSGNFTIEALVYFNDLSTPHTIVSQTTDATHYVSLYWYTNNKLYFEDRNGGGYVISLSVPFTPVINTWYHTALARNGTTENDWNIFVNGVAGSKTLGGGGYAETLINYGVDLIVGRGGAGNYDWNGYLDEVRISKGIARWTSNFTPPTRRN